MANSGIVITLLALSCFISGSTQGLGDGGKTHETLPSTVTLVSGQVEESLRSTSAKALVFIFVSTECPISNSYAPEIQRLSEEFGPHRIEFRLVYPNPDTTVELAAKHLEEFGYHLPALIDHEHRLVKVSGVHVTPEAAVFRPGQGWIYHGRIDNRNVDFGKARPQATTRDLHDVLQAIADGRPALVPSTRAIGCSISSLP